MQPPPPEAIRSALKGNSLNDGRNKVNKSASCFLTGGRQGVREDGAPGRKVADEAVCSHPILDQVSCWSALKCKRTGEGVPMHCLNRVERVGGLPELSRVFSILLFCFETRPV